MYPIPAAVRGGSGVSARVCVYSLFATLAAQPRGCSRTGSRPSFCPSVCGAGATLGHRGSLPSLPFSPGSMGWPQRRVCVEPFPSSPQSPGRGSKQAWSWSRRPWRGSRGDTGAGQGPGSAGADPPPACVCSGLAPGVTGAPQAVLALVLVLLVTQAAWRCGTRRRGPLSKALPRALREDSVGRAVGCVWPCWRTGVGRLGAGR